MARIVLIEDNRDLRNLLADSLVSAGHSVWSTRDASAGVTKCEQWPAEMVITDLVVPNSAALEELLRIRRGADAPHIIVISGALDSPEPASLAQRLAGSNVLAKPFRAATLRRLVNDLLADSTASRV
ncbi:MAG: response regulator [Opitutaceae bacterium]|nr:response regulator [Opitutaceae bacterium]